MPLIDGYGVLAGRLHSYECDNDREENGYYHCNVRVRASGGVYRCAVDLDSKQQSDGLHWRVIDLGRNSMREMASLGFGWHFLDSEPGSGAIDYLRSPELQPTESCLRAGAPAESGCSPWRYGTSMDAFHDLAGVLDNAVKLLVFGEPFRFGRGVHNIHQNQGDPRNSRWSRENGVWQDGAVCGVAGDGSLHFFLCRFKTQATKTDDRGRPL